MRIAVVQMTYPLGHRRLDEEYLRVLSKEHQLVVVDDGKYFSSVFINEINAKRTIVVQPYFDRWEPFKRFLRRLCLVLVLLRLKNESYDCLLFLNIHNSIYRIKGWLPQKRIVIMHHNDVDLLFASEKDYNDFAKTKASFIHVFLADYIKEGFANRTGIDERFLFTVHQPLVFSSVETEGSKDNLLVGLGNSLDEDFIESVIKTDNKRLLPNKLILRSRRVNYDGINVQVIKGFLSREDYEQYYSRAKVSIVYYSDQYRYRYSGIIDDSLAKGLVVYCNDTMCGRYFSQHYPNSIRFFRDASQLWSLMNLKLPQQPVDEHTLFHERHSAEYVLTQFNKALAD